jgi:predicted phosphoribosyltransferase
MTTGEEVQKFATSTSRVAANPTNAGRNGARAVTAEVIEELKNPRRRRASRRRQRRLARSGDAAKVLLDSGHAEGDMLKRASCAPVRRRHAERVVIRNEVLLEFADPLCSAGRSVVATSSSAPATNTGIGRYHQSCQS